MKSLIAIALLTFAVSAHAEVLSCDVTEWSSNVQVEQQMHYDVELMPTQDGFDSVVEFDLNYFSGKMTASYFSTVADGYQEMTLDIGNESVGQTAINEGANWVENEFEYMDPTGQWRVSARCEVKPAVSRP